MARKGKRFQTAQRMSGLPIRSVHPHSIYTFKTNNIQTTNNACATVALVNILMNVPGITFDAQCLDTLRAATADLRPADRGQKLGESQDIREIHNSSAR